MEKSAILVEFVWEEVGAFFAADVGWDGPFFGETLIRAGGMEEFGSPGFALVHLGGGEVSPHRVSRADETGMTTYNRTGAEFINESFFASEWEVRNPFCRLEMDMYSLI